TVLLELPEFEALTEAEIISALSDRVPEAIVKWIEPHIWRGSVASVVYEHIQSFNVHSLGSSGGLGFSKTTGHGKPITEIDFKMLHRALRLITDEAKHASLETNLWFGIH